MACQGLRAWSGPAAQARDRQIGAMTKPNRRAVIVLGMHRSGTSAVTGATIRLGLTPPRTPAPPNEDNPTGFHESVPIAALNHLVLNVLGLTWYHCLSFDPDVLDEAARAAAFDNCVALLRDEFADAPAFVMKDPLLCMTLPIWLAPLRHLGAAVSALIVIRHPDEVARSVFERDALPEDETPAVWLHHLLEAERLTRGLPRAVVFYTELLHDWRGCMARAGRIANIAWPVPPDRIAPEPGEVAIPSLRHHTAGEGTFMVGSPPVRALIGEAWRVFQELADDPWSAPCQARLDRLRARFAVERGAAPADVIT